LAALLRTGILAFARVLNLMVRKNRAYEDCAIARSVDLIGEWGSILILREAFRGVSRFDDLQNALGISRNLLTVRLKKLVDRGVLKREPISTGAKRLGYLLTPMGEDLFATMLSMRQWGERWLFAPGCSPDQLLDSEEKKIIPEIRVRSASGKLLAYTDITVRQRTSRPQAIKPRKSVKSGKRRSSDARG
jgi:DNA-binding HxlR family transcriptional regulator